MAMKADFDTLVRAMNDETNAIATRIDNLTAQVAKNQQPDGSITPADAQAILAAFQSESDRLKQLATNPADPIPGGVGATAGAGSSSGV